MLSSNLFRDVLYIFRAYKSVRSSFYLLLLGFNVSVVHLKYSSNHTAYSEEAEEETSDDERS